MTHIGNVRNEVNIQLNSMQNTVSSLQEGFEKNGAHQRKQLDDMRQLLGGEMKDLRSANEQFSQELDRHQNLYRALHGELMLTLEEKKVQNNTLLEQGKEAAKEELKEKKRAGSVSVSKTQAFSMNSLLPQLRVAVDTSAAKLTQRQVRIANLVRGDQLDMMNSQTIINQDSSLTLRNKFG